MAGRGIAWVTALGLTIGAAAAWFALRPAAEPGWREVAWPFPRDAWSPGLAFRCRFMACGGQVQVYFRPKRGFCANCATGVTGDTEVDSVADLDMMATDFIPTAPGEPIAIGKMEGRLRSYTLLSTAGRRTPALGIAMTRRNQCDLVVAAAQGPDTQAAREAITGLLESDQVTRWIDRQLDGR